MKYQSNISEIVRIKVQQLQDLTNPDQMLRAVALAVLPAVRQRVHVDGLATDGNQIGTYSPGYMVVRTGTYKNAATYKKGKNIGKNKDSGTFTKRSYTTYTQEDEDTISSKRAFLKTEHEKKARPQYHRTDDTKVILSLTRQQENDLSVVPSVRGYGIGYKNEINYQKSQWEEHTYNKRIWGLTVEEHALATKVADDYVNAQFKNT